MSGKADPGRALLGGASFLSRVARVLRNQPEPLRPEPVDTRPPKPRRTKPRPIPRGMAVTRKVLTEKARVAEEAPTRLRDWVEPE